MQIDGTMTASGDITVSGNWTNNGTFNAGLFKVTFDGTNQNITGSNSTTFNHMATATSGTKTLGIGQTVGGTLTVAAGTTLALSTYNLGSPASVVLECGAATGSVISGSGTLTLGGDVTVNDAAGAGTSAATISCPVALGATRSFSVASDGSSATDLDISGIVSNGGCGITKEGAGTMALSANNTYTGAVTINNGILTVASLANAGSNSPLGTGAATPAVTIGASGTLQYTGSGHSTDRSIVLSGSGATIEAAGSGTMTLNGNVTGTYNLVLTGSGNGNMGGIIATSTGSVTKNGAGTWTYSNTNTYSGATNISLGTLKLGASGVISDLSAVTANGTLDLGGYSETIGSLAGSGTVTSSGAGVLTLTAGGDNSNTEFSGLIQNGSATSVALVKNGNGDFTLSGGNTYSGGTTLNTGRLNINHATAIGTGALTINGGTLGNTSGSAKTLTNNNVQNWDGDFAFAGSSDLNLGTGAITLSADRQVTVNSNTLTAGGTINDNTLNFTKAGTGTLSFGSNNVTLDYLTISAGTLVSTSGNLSLAGYFASNGTFTHNSGTVIFNGSGAQTISGSSAATFNNLTLNNSNGLSLSGSVGATVNGAFTFTAGKFTTNANILTMGSGASFSGQGSSAYVYGNLLHTTTTGAQSKVFPVGDASIYAPVTVAFTSLGTAGTLELSTDWGDHAQIVSSGINSNKSVNRTWEFTAATLASYSADVTFNWDATDKDGGTDFNNYIVARYNGSGWTRPSVSDKASTSIKATGITTFSQYQVGEAWSSGSGDYFESFTTGNWSTPGTWLSSPDNINWGLATVAPGGSASLITIQSGHTVTVNTNPTSASSVVIDGTLNCGSATLAVNGNWDNNNTFTAGTGTIEFNGTVAQSINGNISAFNNLTISNSANLVSTAANITVSGSLAVNAGGVLDPGAGNTVGGTGTLSGSGTVNVTRKAPTSNPNFLTQYSISNKTLTNLTVDYCGLGDQTVSAVNYGNLTISPVSRTVTLSGSIGVSGVFSPSLSSNTYVVTGSTVDFNGSGAQDIPPFTYNNLNTSNGGTKTLDGTVTVNNVLTVGGSTILNLSAETLTLAGSGTPLSISGTFTASTSTVNYTNAGSTNITATNYNNLDITGGARVLLNGTTIGIAGTFTPGGGGFTVTGSTVSFNGSGSQTIPAFTFNNLNTATGGTKTLGGTVTVNGVLTVGGSTELDLSSQTLNLAGSGTPLVITGTFTASSSTVNYTNAGSTNITATNFYDLNGTGGDRVLPNGGTVGIAGAFTPGLVTWTITGSTVNFNSSGSQTIPAFNYNNLTSSNGGARTLASSGTIGVAGTFTPGASSYTVTGSTVNFNGGAQNIPAFTFNNLTASNGNTKTLSGAVIAGGNVSIAGSTTLSTGAGNYAINVAGNWSNSGTFTANTGTVTFDGSGNQTLSGSNSFYNLTIYNSGTGTTVSASGSTLVVTALLRIMDGTFISASDFHHVQIDIGTTLEAAGDMTVSGNWTNNGTFTPGSWTVTFDGATQTINGATATTFNNLTISSSVSTTLGQNVTCAGNLSVTGPLLDLSAYTANRTASGGSLSLSSGSTLKIGGTNGFPTNYATTNLDANSTVEYNGGAQTVADDTYGHLILSGGSAKTLSASVTTVAGNFTISGSGTSATANNSVNTTGNFTLGAGTTFVGGAYTHTVGGNWSKDATATFTATGSTIEFNGTGTANVSASNFDNLKFSGSGAKTATGILSVTGNLNIVSGNFNAGSYSHTVGGNWSYTGTFNAGTSTFNFNASIGQALSGNSTFYNLTFSGSNTKLIDDPIVISNTFTISGAAKASMDNHTTSTANALVLGAIARQSGTWGSSGSTATNKNDFYFLSTATGYITVATGSCDPGLWVGDASTVWTTTQNWCGGAVPTSSVDVTIPAAATTLPVISSAVNAACKNLTVESGTGTRLTISAGGSLTISGNVVNNGTIVMNDDVDAMGEDAQMFTTGSASGSGTVTFYRWMAGGRSYLVSPPVTMSGSCYNWLTNPEKGVEEPAEGVYRMTEFYESTNAWGTYPFYTSGSPGSFTPGKGHLIRRATDGTVYFTGSMNAGNIYTSIPLAQYGWNLVGNPFTFSIGITNDATTTQKFLSENSSVLNPYFTAIYVWDAPNGIYKAISNGSHGGYNTFDNDYAQAGQGFFVRAATVGNSVKFSNEMCKVKQDETLKKGVKPWEFVEVIARMGTMVRSVSLGFYSTMTAGLDQSYDAGLYKTTKQFEFYTRLIDDNGIDFQIQCLPVKNYDNFVIPLGFDIPAGGTVTLTVGEVTLAKGYFPVLWDKLLNKYTALKSSADQYTVTLGPTSGIGRFYLMILKKVPTRSEIAAETAPAVSFSAWFASGRINILGNVEQETSVTMYDINGKNFGQYRLQKINQNVIPAEGLPNGMYLLRISDGKSVNVLKIPVIN